MASKVQANRSKGQEERRYDRNQVVQAAWVMLLVGVFTLIRPLLSELPSVITGLGLSSSTSIYYLTDWHADTMVTYGLGVLVVFGAISVTRGQPRWLWVGALLLSIDLVLLTLCLLTADNLFDDTVEGLLLLALRAVTWWIVLRGSLAVSGVEQSATVGPHQVLAPRKRQEQHVEPLAAYKAAAAETVANTPAKAVAAPQPRFCATCGEALNPGARFCPGCGSPIAERTATAVGEPKPNSTAAAKPTARKTANKRNAAGRSVHQTAASASPRNMRRLALAATLVVAAVLLFAFRADIGSWIEPQQPTGIAASVSLNRTESPATGSKEVKVEPVPGFTIHAPKDALDRDRTFAVTPLTEAEITALEGSVTPDFTPIQAYHFDAGMAADQSTPGYIQLSFDLAELGVDEALWGSMAVMRINGEESDLLASSVDDGKLTAFTKKNSVIVTGTLLTIATALGNYAVTSTENGWYGKYLRDEPAYETMVFRHVYYPTKSPAEMMGSTDTMSLDSINEVVGEKYYRLVWPETLRPADPDEVNWARGELSILLDKYGLGENGMIGGDAAGLRKARLQAQIKLNQDWDYRDLVKATVNDAAWIRDNLWPAEVRATAEAIDIADKYLFQDRTVKFDRPWNVTDILVLSPLSKKMTGDMYAVEVDLAFTAPYIMVNAAHNSIPASAKDFSVEAKRFGIENLALTLVHEMVHVFQDISGLPDLVSKNYLWLYEAEAVLVENEAYTALKGKVLHGDYTTDRSSWYTLASSLDAAVDEGAIDQNRGYVASRFLEYLRDRYYAGNPDAFAVNLRKDLSNYLPQFVANRLSGSEIRATTLDAVVRQTSSSWRELANQYTQFCQHNSATMVKDFRYTKQDGNRNKAALEAVYKAANTETTALLSPASPLYTLRSRPGEHLSASFTEIKVDQLSAQQRAKALLALLTPTYTGEGDDQIKVFWSGDVATFKAYSTEQAVTVPLPTSGLFYLQQIHDYSNTARVVSSNPRGEMFADYDRPSKSKTSDILLLIPLEAPSLSFDSTREVLTIAWHDDSKLRDLAQADGTPYLTRYQVTIQHSGRQSPIQRTLDRERTELEIPLSDLGPDKAAGSATDPKEYTLSVSVQQIVAAQPALAGPNSQATEIKIGKEKPVQTVDGGIVGHWQIYSTYSNGGWFAPPGLNAEQLAQWSAERGISGKAEDRKFNIVFGRDGSFYAEVRTSEGIIDASFSGTYTSIEQQQSPGAFIYLADINPATVINKGPMPYRNIREGTHDLKFYFSEKDGKRLLYEETGQYYLE
ncbi:MAG: zinc ribbon domain-containing protein [Chloroflexota bacterium]